MYKSYKDAWSNENTCLSYTSSKTWLSKTKRGPIKDIKTESILTSIWKTSSKCFEGILAR